MPLGCAHGMLHQCAQQLLQACLPDQTDAGVGKSGKLLQGCIWAHLECRSYVLRH